MASIPSCKASATVSFFIAALCVQSTGNAQDASNAQSANSAQLYNTATGFDYGVSAGLGYSDNIQRTPSNEKDETYASAGLDLTYKEDSRLLYSNTAIDVVYLDYLQHTFSNEVVGNANVNFDVRIAPGKFEWLLQDNFGQVRSDPFAPVTPDNRENVNYFTTGPQFTAHLSSTMRAQLTGQYSKITYQRSNTDNDRYGASIALIRDLSSAAHASLNVSSERTNFANDSVGADYDTNSAYFDFSLKGARTIATVDLGYSQIKRGGEKTGGTLARLQLQRQLTPSSKLSLRGGRELTSSGDVFRSEQTTQPVNLDVQLATQAVDPIVRTYVGLGWDFARARTGFGLSIDWTKEAHQQQTTLDRKNTTASVYATRDITSTLSARLSVNYVKEDYEVAQVDSNEVSESLGVAWRLSKMLTTSLQLQHYNRNSDVPNTDYAENRAWLQFVYGNARPLL